MPFLLASVTEEERQTLGRTHPILAGGQPEIVRKFVNDFFGADVPLSREDLEAHLYVILWLQRNCLELLTSKTFLDVLVCLAMDNGGALSVPRKLWHRWHGRGIRLHVDEHDMGLTVQVYEV